MRHGLDVDFVDPTVEENVINAIRPETKVNNLLNY